MRWVVLVLVVDVGCVGSRAPFDATTSDGGGVAPGFNGLFLGRSTVTYADVVSPPGCTFGSSLPATIQVVTEPDGTTATVTYLEPQCTLPCNPVVADILTDNSLRARPTPRTGTEVDCYVTNVVIVDNTLSGHGTLSVNGYRLTLDLNQVGIWPDGGIAGYFGIEFVGTRQ
jgi:hypothetical protein